MSISMKEINYDEPVIVRFKSDAGETKLARVTKKPDIDPDNCRDWDCNLGVMTCWHRRYALGDAHAYETPEDYLRQLLLTTTLASPYFGAPINEYVEKGAKNVKYVDNDPTHRGSRMIVARTDDEEEWFYVNDTPWPATHKSTESWLAAQAADFLTISEIKAILDSFPELCILPLYLIDHGLISMRTSDYGDLWDSGQVGFICTTLQKANEMWCTSYDPKKASDVEAWKARAKGELKDEVEVYSQFLEGDVYGVIIEEYTGPLSQFSARSTSFADLESCWGFYDDESGEDFVESALSTDSEIIGDDEITAIREQAIKDEKEYIDKRNRALRALLGEHVNHTVAIEKDAKQNPVLVCVECGEIILDAGVHTFCRRSDR